jgi:HEAT repeat protein
MSSTRASLLVLTETPSWEWPDHAGADILTVLEDPAAPAAERLLAAELGGDLVVMDDDIAGALLAIVRDGGAPDDLRTRAALALGPVLELVEAEGLDDAGGVPISEETFDAIRATLQAVYRDGGVDAGVRRRVLEAAVRAPQDWQTGAVRGAWASGDRAWRVTAVFCMGYVPGFDEQILEALESGDAELRHEAIVAAGERELAAAWPHVAALLRAGTEDKALLLSAIEAASGIRPHEAPKILRKYAKSKDDDISEAAGEAIAMADVLAEMSDTFEEE